MKPYLLLTATVFFFLFSKAQTTNIEPLHKNEFGVKFYNILSFNVSDNRSVEILNTNTNQNRYYNYRIYNNINLIYKKKIKNNYLRIETPSYNVQVSKLEYDIINTVPGQTPEPVLVKDKSKFQYYGIQIGYEIRKKSNNKIDYYYGPIINPNLVRVSAKATFEDNVILNENIKTKVVNNTFNIGVGGVFGVMYQLGNSPLALFAEITPIVNYRVNEFKEDFINEELNTKESEGGFSSEYLGAAQLGLLFKF